MKRSSYLALALCLVLVALLWYGKVVSNLMLKETVERSDKSQGDDSDLYTIPPSLDQLSHAELLVVYHRLTNSFGILCRNHMRLGPLEDGGKEICADKNVKPRQPCLVYSFGSNNQFGFEEMAVDFLHCEVHTFDHTMDRFKNIKVPRNVTLHVKGLDGHTNRTKNLWTIDDLIDELGHKGRVIDILKLDIEEYEWPVLDQMMTSGTLNLVRQLLVEFHMDVGEQRHIPKTVKANRVKVLSRLYNFGFRAFSRDKDRFGLAYHADLPHPVANLLEMSFINLRFL